MSAVIAFLETEQGELFGQDLTREAMVLTYNTGGWLQKKAQLVSGAEAEQLL